MREATVVVRSSPLEVFTRGWRVYRIRTENSLYELEVQDAAGQFGRRCVVLTCVEPATRHGEMFEDSAPQLGLKNLFEVSPMEWIGGRLRVGTAETSIIREVDFVSSRATPAGLTRLKPRVAAVEPSPPPAAPPSPPPRPNPWDSFPEGYVQMAEAAASVLTRVCHRDDLAFAVRGNDRLERRLQLALAECRLMLDAMARR